MAWLRPSLEGRWGRALVTGASSGFGREFARQLAAAGTEVVVVARRRPLLDELAGELRAAGGRVEVLPADLGDPEQLASVARACRERPLDLLVNNAGGAVVGPFVDRDDGLAEVDVNVAALVRLTRAALPPMVRRGRGAVLNVSSGLGFYPVPRGALYAASKAFVTSFSRAVGYELRGTGVTVTAACPGFSDTGGPTTSGVRVERVPRPLWTPPPDVVRGALRATARGDAVWVDGAVNRANAWLGQHLPRSLLLPVVAAAQRRLAPTP